VKRILPVFFGSLALLSAGSAAGESLSSAVEKVAAKSPGLQGARAQMEAAESEFSAARAQRYPRLAVRSAYLRGNNPVHVFGSLLEQQTFGSQNFAVDALNSPGDRTHIKNAFDLGVPLFAGFETVSGEKIRRMAAAQARERLGLTDQKVRFAAVDGYLFALLKRKTREAIQERIRSAEKEIEDARKLNAKGLVPGSDFYAAQAILSALIARDIQTQSELEAAEKRLAVLMGESPGALNLTGSLSSGDYPAEKEEALVERALSVRKDAQEAALGVSSADLAAEQAKRSFLPRIEAFASLETNTEDFKSNPTNRTFGVRSNFPIGDPALFSRNSKARAAAKAARNQKQEVEESIRLEVIEALNGYEGARAGLPMVQEAARQSEKSLELFRPLYREGRQSILEVLRAEEGLARAQTALLENLYRIHFGYARLRLATGTLETAAVREIQDRLEAQP
jgi:outer membrane protein TolC